MKHLLLSSCLLFYLPVYGQNKETNFIGKYQDHFGSEIIIDPDSIFKYRWSFDMERSWSNGKWSVKNDTIYFKTVLVYDTLKVNGKDTLIISLDEKPERIKSLNTGILYSGGQGLPPCPNKLFYRNNTLYGLTKSGKLNRKRVKGFWTRKKFDLMYHRESEK